MKRYLLITIVLAAVVIISGLLLYRFSKREVPSVSPSVSGGDSSLEGAVALLPDNEPVVSGDEIAPNLFWAWTEEVVPDYDGETHYVTSWLIDTDSGEVTTLDEREYGFPGVSVSHDRSDDRYYHVGWNAGWEQGTYARNEYIDRSTGRIAYTFETSSAGTLEITHEDQHLRIQVDPADGCERFANEALVDGIRVNNRFISVDPPELVACVTNDMTGEASYAFGFEDAGLAEMDEVIRVELPWDQALEIPADMPDEQEAQLMSR